METNTPNTIPNQAAAANGYPPDFAQRTYQSKTLIAIVAVLGVTVMALAAALVVNKSDAQPNVAAYQAPAAAITPAPVPVTAAPLVATNTPPAPAPAPAKIVQRAPVVAQHTPPRAAVCASCGTVEAVSAVQRQGQVNGVAVGNTTVGLGTVAGGVVGGLLGNQVGGGNGKTAMTVLGVAGGAFAGNQIEKNMKKVTVYAVRVRMDDGTTRNMEVSSSVPVGSRVTVEGKNLRLA